MDLIQIIQHQIMLNYMKAQSEALQSEFLPAGKFQAVSFVDLKKKIESKCISAPARTAFDLQTIINKATTTNQMELLTLEEAKFLIGTEFIFLCSRPRENFRAFLLRNFFF